jgi:chromosome segregation ATPase
MDALRDRGIFEAECKAAKEEAAALNRSLESSRVEVTTLRATRAELEKKLAEANNALLNSPNTDLVKMAEMEKELNVAKTEVQRLEKRIVVMQSDNDYSKNMYNQASQRATELSSENRAYEGQIAELKRRADDNILQANKIQARQEARALALQVRDSRNQLRDRELELNRARDELRALRNGRRETRQSSVPHSPRLSSLGVMSPRNGNRVPSAMGGPSSSRGTSPAPPTGVFDGPAGSGTNAIPNSSLFNQGPGASRFSHLRDQRF